ncbi:YheC/YheD family protein [Metabacillus herbersteinensis]|uniref:YheC/YheD family protein n=1 Tax=Metabacillus herbersteinensis TaxID=283816 RepID=A0ABV6GG06_9BACI
MDSTTLGFLTLNLNHENKYVTEIAKRSLHYKIECVRFEPTSISPANLEVKGEHYDHSAKEWMSSVFSIPPFIYDRCFYQKNQLSQKSKPIVEWLKNYHKTTFLGQGLPDKWKIHKALQKDSILSCYLPQTILVKDSVQIQQQLAAQGACLLKPINGSKGLGIFAVKLEKKFILLTYHIGRDKQNRKFPSLQEFGDWCQKLLQQNDYLLQPFLSLQDTQGYPFDIRLLLQKNEEGNWCLRGKGIRKGYYGSFLSNLNTGGESLIFEDWFNSLTAHNQVLVNDELKTISDRLPTILEGNFPNLFELGVDIGFAKDGSLWILDINSKPGRKVILQTKPNLEDTLYEAPLTYCRFLKKQSSLKGVEPIE